jgi:ligand-binding SRPBCC domain-containing protein
MPEFKVYTRIEASYETVWQMASIIENVERWSPVRFKNVAPEERIRNGLNLLQTSKQFGVFGAKELTVVDTYINSRVRRQFSFADSEDPYKFNRITYMFDDNSLSTMIDLAEDEETKDVLRQQADEEPQYQIDVMAHVFYTFGSSFWRSLVEAVFISPFFKLLFQRKVTKSLAKLKALCEENREHPEPA